MDELGRLPLHRGNDFGMAMAGGNYGYTRIEVKKGVAVNILNHSSQATSCNERITSRVGWRDVAMIQFDDALGIRPGQRRNQSWQLCIQEGVGSSRFFRHKTIVHALWNPESGNAY